MKPKYGKKLTLKLINKIIIVTIIYTILFILFWFIGRIICSFFIWDYKNFLYRLLTGIGYNLFFLIIIWLIGFIIITIICLRKTLNYIDAILNASELLIENNETWITLPSDLIEIEDRMNEINQKALYNARLAKENLDRKNELIVYLAHDIKTPLTSMIGYLSLLDEISDMPKKQQRKYIEIALKKSMRLEELINELFDITRFNSHELELDIEEINLNLMLEQIIDDFYPLLKEANKEIKLLFKDKIVIEGDSDKLARVFNNVIKNAIAYSYDNSKILIEVVKDFEYASIIISNQGKKISPQKLEKIFEKFYRLDESRTSKTGGSGLGLAIAKEIVLLHQGTIYATSDFEYTRFYIKLPLVQN